MITTEEISVRVYQMLCASEVPDMITGVVDYERNDYSKEDVIIVPHTIDGEDAFPRFGQINVNIHVPDVKVIAEDGSPIFRIAFQRLIDIRAKVIEVLKNHYESGDGWNWYIGRLNPPIKEQNHDEHFVSLALELTVRERKN